MSIKSMLLLTSNDALDGFCTFRRAVIVQYKQFLVLQASVN
jgi:hypothetical protein